MKRSFPIFVSLALQLAVVSFLVSVVSVVSVVFVVSEAHGQSLAHDRIRVQLASRLVIGEQFEIEGRYFKLNRVDQGQLGGRVLRGVNSDNEFMVIAEDADGNLYGSVLMDGANFRIMSDGSLRRAGRVSDNDVIVRQAPPSERVEAFDEDACDTIIDRWHQPGWRNMVTRADGSKVGLCYTSELDLAITKLDIFVYFDLNIGGTPRAFIDAEIAKANEIFQRSGVHIRLNLVGYELIDLPVERGVSTLSNMGQSRSQFSNLDAVRQNSGADIIYTFATEDDRRNLCGVAYMGGYKGRWDYRDGLGLSACHGGETFAHEVAHNLGSDHDEANAGDGYHFRFSHGFNVLDQNDIDYLSTVMSYGTAEVGMFSSPNLSCKGEPCGNAERANNVASLNHNRKWVAKANGPIDGSSVGVFDTADSDTDGVQNNSDNCPNNYNPNQADNDGDGVGNVCDSTPDGVATVSASAGDGGSIDPSGDLTAADGGLMSFTLTPDSGYQIDEVGGSCSAGSISGNTYITGEITADCTVRAYFSEITNGGPDADNDGVSDSDDNCPNDYNPDQADEDGDGIGNVCDSSNNDADNDGVSDSDDNCPNDYNPDQADEDGDGKGNVCDDTPDGGPAQQCSEADYYLDTQEDVDELGATGCDRVLGNLWVGGANVTNLDGLANLKSVGGDLQVSNTRSLTNLNGLVNITSVGGGLWIRLNDAVTNLDGLANLKSVAGYLRIWDNGSLTNIDGLSNITTVEGNLDFSGNDALTNIDGLSNITSVGDRLIITNADALTNLDGLANLKSVGGSLLIWHNGFLTNCQGIAPVLGWPNGPPDDAVGDSISLISNGFGCNSVDEILASVVSEPTKPSITSTASEDGRITLRVSVSDNGGASITRYGATCTDGNITHTSTSASSAITVAGLTNGVAYTCTVTATNSVGTSLASAPTDPITPVVQTAPAKPAITQTDHGDGELYLYVTASNGGEKFTWYDATCTDGTNTYTGFSLTSSITVSGLTNDVAYTCTVTATNSVGTSSVSSVTAPITPEEQVGSGLPIWLLYQATQ